MRPIIALDLDGVLASWETGTHDVPGTPIPGAQWFVGELLKYADVVLHTCRLTPEYYTHLEVPGEDIEDTLASILITWLDRHDFPKGMSLWQEPGKPMATLYIDDRAVRFRPGEEKNFRFYELIARKLVEDEDRITSVPG